MIFKIKPLKKKIKTRKFLLTSRYCWKCMLGFSFEWVRKDRNDDTCYCPKCGEWLYWSKFLAKERDWKLKQPPVGVKFIDLGEGSTCTICEKRYCTCRARRNGTLENNLQVQFIEKND